jgi:hypothetical protein
MPRTSPNGYDTTKGPDVRWHDVYIFDYSDVTRKARDIRKAVSQMGDAAWKLQKSGLVGKNEFGFYIDRAKTDWVNEVTTAILPADGVNLQVELTKDAQAFGAKARDNMRNFVNRIETGTMKREVRYRIRKNPKMSELRVEVGWVRLWYKYFDYQERGTSNIPPMNAVLKSRMVNTPEFQQTYSRFVRSYVLKADKRGAVR